MKTSRLSRCLAAECGSLGVSAMRPAAELSVRGLSRWSFPTLQEESATSSLARWANGSADLGQPVVIENRAGGTTAIGTEAVAQGQARRLHHPEPDRLRRSRVVLQEKLPYDLERDFMPIISIGSFPMVLAVPVASKFNSFADLVAAVKSKEGITYASGGSGTLAHLSAVRLINELSGTGNHIPYRGNSDATQALLGNQVQLFFPGSAEALPLAKSGKVRLLGVTSDQRLSSLPDVPTMKELGFADFTPRLWYAFLVPASTPHAVVSRLHAPSQRRLWTPVQERLAHSASRRRQRILPPYPRYEKRRSSLGQSD